MAVKTLGSCESVLVRRDMVAVLSEVAKMELAKEQQESQLLNVRELIK